MVFYCVLLSVVVSMVWFLVLCSICICGVMIRCEVMFVSLMDGSVGMVCVVWGSRFQSNNDGYSSVLCRCDIVFLLVLELVGWYVEVFVEGCGEIGCVVIVQGQCDGIDVEGVFGEQVVCFFYVFFVQEVEDGDVGVMFEGVGEVVCIGVDCSGQGIEFQWLVQFVYYELVCGLE